MLFNEQVNKRLRTVIKLLQLSRSVIFHPKASTCMPHRHTKLS